ASWNVEALRVDVIQAEKAIGQVPHRVANMNPLFTLVEVDIAQTVSLDDVELLVLPLAQPGVDDDRPVVARVDQFLAVAIAGHGPYHPIELPRSGGAAGKEEVPRDVDLERGVGVLGQNLLVSGEVHQPMVVGHHRRRTRTENRDVAGHVWAHGCTKAHVTPLPARRATHGRCGRSPAAPSPLTASI